MGNANPDWQSQLEQDGFVVVPSRIPLDQCAEFREEALGWLEKFPHGFRWDDRSTWTSRHLPWGIK